MMNALERRMDRLQYPPGANPLDGLAERLEAARKRGKDNSDAARRATTARIRAILQGYEADVVARRRVDPLAARLATAYRRTGAAA